jgi:hypothetical protein
MHTYECPRSECPSSQREEEPTATACPRVRPACPACPPCSHEVRFRAAQLGEADALAALAREESEQFIKSIGGPTYISGLKGKRLGEYRATAAKLEREDLRASTAKDELKRALDAFEAELEVCTSIRANRGSNRANTAACARRDECRDATRRDDR